MYSFRSGKPVVAGIEDLPPVVVVDVVEEVDACGDPRLDSLRVLVVGVAAVLLDMAAWLGEARTGEDVDGGRP